MRNTIKSIIFLLFIIISCQNKNYVDLIIYGGTIYTVDSINSKVESIAVKDGKIYQTGSYNKISLLINKNTKVIDLDGKIMIPGFIEGHAHIMGTGYNQKNIDLLNTSSFDEIVEIVKNKSNEIPDGEWIIGRGWHQDKWIESPEKLIKGFPTHNKLSEAVPNHPVYLRHASGHASLANKKAMELFKIDKKSSNPDGGEIFKDITGNPTGVFNETAQGLISPPESTFEDHLVALKMANNHAIKNGITTFHDAGSDFKDIKAYKELAKSGELDLRLVIMLNGNNDSLLNHYYEIGPEIGLYDNHLTVRSIKLYADGALGSRGAWLIEDYEDAEGEHGHIVTPVEKLKKVTKEGFDNGFQICTHAIGDMANREVLNIYSKHLKKGNNSRFRIEHAQHIDLKDIPRFSELGVIAAIQGIHMSSDRPWAINRLGQKRIEESAYVWRDLINYGAVLINGSDVPVEPIDPIASFYASTTRKTLKGLPDFGYEPKQKMTRIEALKSYTINAAYGAFEDQIKGSIEIGKYADFTVFSQNLITIPEEKILDTKVLYTIVNGVVEYQAN